MLSAKLKMPKDDQAGHLAGYEQQIRDADASGSRRGPAADAQDQLSQALARDSGQHAARLQEQLRKARKE